MKSISILLADSLDIFRKGLESIVSENKELKLLGSAVSGKSLIKKFRKHPEAICIISSTIADLNIHEIMQKLKAVNNGVRVIVLTNSTEISHLNQSLKTGVKGYLTKTISESELIEAVNSVANGKQAFGKSISQLMIGKYADLAKNGSNTNRRQITKREREVLKLIVDGYTSSEIAKLLFISPRTVETHRSNLMNKLEIKNTAALVRYALEDADLS
ncbi:MAG: response regulator transcription factor [Balneolaceae bacterium]